MPDRARCGHRGRPRTIARLIAGFQELSRKKKSVHGEDEYGEGIYEALRERTGSFQQVYGIVGHTHRMDIQELGTLNGVRSSTSTAAPGRLGGTNTGRT